MAANGELSAYFAAFCAAFACREPASRTKSPAGA
jgi:hypothetical protein